MKNTASYLMAVSLLLTFCSSFVLSDLKPKVVQSHERCCDVCELPTIKYYSLVGIRCGESCLDPKDYWKYKIFEPKMAKAESNTPCVTYGYPVYNETQIHSIGSLKVAVDLFIRDNAE